MRALNARCSYRVLLRRGWEPSSTLVYLPEPEPAVAVMGRMFAWDSHSPVIWMFASVGLSAVEQAAEGRPAFRRFEVVLATNNHEVEDPFPARLGVALSNPLPAWDWSQVTPPPLLDWFAGAARAILELVRGCACVAIGDSIDTGPGGGTWTRSVLEHSVVLPATPHMLALGLAPYDGPDDENVTLNANQWHTDPGTSRFESGFYWLLPVSEAERVRGARDGVWNLFADLVDLAPPGANDDCAAAFDLLRRARV